MKFSDVEALPAVVLDNNDPKNLGRIKVAIPGKWDTASICVENLPWVMPFTQSGYQSFSKQLKGSKVWVLDNKENPYEYWYVPMFEMNENTSKISSASSESDVILSRSTGIGDATINYNSDTGITIGLNDKGIAVNNDGNIVIQGQGSCVNIDNKVTIGSEGSTEPVILANKFQEQMDKVVNALSNSIQRISAVPYANAIVPLLEELKNIYGTISKMSQSNNTEMN